MKNVLQYLERTVARVPDRLAISDGREGQGLTFFELYEGARRMASALCERGLCGKRVAILMERHPATVMAMLGVRYAGACYSPLDVSMPRERMHGILSRADAALLVCDDQSRSLALQMGLAVCSVEELLAADVDESALAHVRAEQIDTDPIYIIFTSGSTGVPKGVVGCHRAVIDYAEALIGTLGFEQDCVFGCQSPLYFDAPLKELLTTLAKGATTYLIPKRLFSFPVLLLRYLNEHGINTICWVSSALSAVAALGALDAETPTTLRTVVFGSETLPLKAFYAWREALPRADFWQLYGPTEATGMSCYFHVDRPIEPGERIPIGRPFDNTGLILLSEQGERILPKAGQCSEAGEILLRGSCLTLGYDHDDRNDECFIQNPLQSAYGERVYRTGDMACYNARGELEFLGRKDGQLKRMGHRIETGEIEASALGLPGVWSAACLVCGREGKLTLFYTGEPEQSQLVRSLGERLPRYLLPDRIQKMSEIPLTDNGKIDRQALAKRAREE